MTNEQKMVWAAVYARVFPEALEDMQRSEEKTFRRNRERFAEVSISGDQDNYSRALKEAEAFADNLWTLAAAAAAREATETVQSLKKAAAYLSEKEDPNSNLVMHAREMGGTFT